MKLKIAFFLVTIAVLAVIIATTQATDSIVIGEEIQAPNQLMGAYPISLSGPEIGACEILLADTLRVERMQDDRVFLRLIKTKISENVRAKHFGCAKGVLFVVSRDAYLSDLKSQYLAVKAIETKTQAKK